MKTLALWQAIYTAAGIAAVCFALIALVLGLGHAVFG